MPDFDEHDDVTPETPEASVPSGDDRTDPRLRPPDPAGTRPRVEPESLLPSSHEPLLHSAPAADIDAEGIEVPIDEADPDDDERDLLPTRRPSGAPALAAASGPSPHAGRFGFAMGALLAVAVAGVALAALVISDRNNTGPRGPIWSAWMPTKNGGDAPTQIADHIGALYRLPTGRQLVLVTGGSLKVSGVNLDVAEEGATTKDPVKVISGSKTVMYRMCGLPVASAPGTAASCVIPGTPSLDRAFLLHREALELALYTFQYTDANGVVVVLPPSFKASGKGGKLTAADLKTPMRTAAYFQRKQFSDQLNRPVTATLTPTTPSIATVTKAPDWLAVKGMTDPSLYSFSLTAGNTEDKGYLVLQK